MGNLDSGHGYKVQLGRIQVQAAVVLLYRVMLDYVVYWMCVQRGFALF